MHTARLGGLAGDPSQRLGGERGLVSLPHGAGRELETFWVPSHGLREVRRPTGNGATHKRLRTLTSSWQSMSCQSVPARSSPAIITQLRSEICCRVLQPVFLQCLSCHMQPPLGWRVTANYNRGRRRNV